MPKRNTPYRPARLPSKLLAIRTRLGLSQSQMATRLQSKVSASRISEYEHAVRLPSLLVLLRYSQIARMHMETIVDDRVDLEQFEDELEFR